MDKNKTPDKKRSPLKGNQSEQRSTNTRKNNEIREKRVKDEIFKATRYHDDKISGPNFPQLMQALGYLPYIDVSETSNANSLKEQAKAVKFKNAMWTYLNPFN